MEEEDNPSLQKEPFYLLEPVKRDPEFVSAEFDLVKQFKLLEGREYTLKQRKALTKSFVDTINPALLVNLKARSFRPSKKHKKKDTGLLKLLENKMNVTIVPLDDAVLRRAFALQPGKAPKKRPKNKKAQTTQEGEQS